MFQNTVLASASSVSYSQVQRNINIFLSTPPLWLYSYQASCFLLPTDSITESHLLFPETCRRMKTDWEKSYCGLWIFFIFQACLYKVFPQWNHTIVSTCTIIHEDKPRWEVDSAQSASASLQLYLLYLVPTRGVFWHHGLDHFAKQKTSPTERDLKNHLVPVPCHGQKQLSLDLVWATLSNPGLQSFQEWCSHNFSGNPLLVPHYPHSKYSV